MSNEANVDINSDQDEATQESKQSTTLKSPEKRAWLEVNKIEKYKPFLINKLETKKFKPSSTLSKVRDFLPMLKQSTDKLLEEYKENPDQVNIENVDDEQEHIEMNLALVAQSDSDSDEQEESEGSEGQNESGSDSSADSIDDLNLGFKVRDPNKVKKLNLDSKKTPIRKDLIQVVNDDQEQNNEEAVD
ncbi:hypothetical protein BpHYR1_046538 [Brachionus plicatilis]|uniref:Uncharacterized protein n=1 Tax=Brachionus plicatilis TaxID=10195 RepID=A0A3M7REJ8_BRAPC|nr:hypothetical protein BpHYR1_046538 [Brachionus plicatilis]